MATDRVDAREAKHGEKMIEVKVRLWTDGIAEGKSQVLPKHAWSGGVVRIARNDAHGIRPLKPIPFNSLAELPGKIEKLLINQGIQIHLTSREKRYIAQASCALVASVTPAT